MTKESKDTDKPKYLDIRKILINNTKITYKNKNKNRSKILEAIIIKKNRVNKISITMSINILNIFHNNHPPKQI